MAHRPAPPLENRAFLAQPCGFAARRCPRYSAGSATGHLGPPFFLRSALLYCPHRKNGRLGPRLQIFSTGSLKKSTGFRRRSFAGKTDPLAPVQFPTFGAAARSRTSDPWPGAPGPPRCRHRGPSAGRRPVPPCRRGGSVPARAARWIPPGSRRASRSG